MEPKKVTINYALLCKELEKQGKTKEKFSAELGRSKSFVCNMAKNPEQTEDFERTMCLLLGLEPGSLVKEPEKKGMTAAQALTVIRDEILENRRIMQENFEKNLEQDEHQYRPTGKDQGQGQYDVKDRLRQSFRVAARQDGRWTL